MNRGPTYLGSIVNGVFQLDNRDVFKKSIARLEGKRVALTLCEWKPTRSEAQNRWYWGVAIPAIAEHIGEVGIKGAQRIHEGLKFNILPHDLSNPLLPTIGSTSTLNVIEFSRYMEAVVQVAAELGVQIPLPSERELPPMRAAKEIAAPEQPMLAPPDDEWTEGRE